MQNDFSVLISLDAMDEPHLLPRLLGQVTRKGGRIESVNSFRISNELLRCVMTVRGCRPDFLCYQMKKVDGVECCTAELKNE